MEAAKRTFFCVVQEPGDRVTIEFLKPSETDKFLQIESIVLAEKLGKIDLNYAGARFKFEGASQAGIFTATLIRDEEATQENAQRLRGKMRNFLDMFQSQPPLPKG